jgi:hypothetical protein
MIFAKKISKLCLKFFIRLFKTLQIGKRSNSLLQFVSLILFIFPNGEISPNLAALVSIEGRVNTVSGCG